MVSSTSKTGTSNISVHRLSVIESGPCPSDKASETLIRQYEAHSQHPKNIRDSCSSFIISLYLALYYLLISISDS